jgi:hypothetical protein
MGQGRRPKKPTPPATAFRQSIRVRIVAACTEEEVCPPDFADREGIEKAKASRYFRELADEGYLWVSRREQARGSTSYYYAAIRQAMVPDAEFATMIPRAQHKFTEATLRDLLQRYGKAWRGGTLHRRGADLLHNELCRLDLEGWRELMQLLEGALQRALDLEAAAKVRARREGEQLTQGTMALAGYVSPPDSWPQEGPAVFFDFFRRSYVAFMSGWLDARDDSHLTWVPLELDEQGWNEFDSVLRELRQRANEIQGEAAERLGRNDKKGIPTTFAFAGFQSPPKNQVEALSLAL